MQHTMNTQSEGSATAAISSNGCSSRRGALLSSLALNGGLWRWSPGIEASIANALPMVLFSLAGHLSLGLIASLGAFTALYGTTMHLRERLRVVPLSQRDSSPPPCLAYCAPPMRGSQASA